MFGLITSLFTGPYGFLLKIGAILAVIGAIWLHGRSFGVNSMKPDLALAQSNAAKWEGAYKNTLTLMQAQNKAVDALKLAQDTKLRLRDQKLTEARLEADKWRNAAQRKEEILANLELPKDECTALTELIDRVRQ